MEKRIISQIILISLLAMVLFSRGHAEGNGLKQITVSDEMELLQALGSDRIITIAEGSFINLSKVLEFSDLRETAGIVDEEKLTNFSEFKGVMSSGAGFEGRELSLIDLRNLVIVGAGETRPKIVIEPRYSYIFNFINCKEITLRHLEIGHTDEGYCTGGVLKFNNCERVIIDDCDLYGCGTEGITALRTNSLQCTRTIIRDCTYSILSLFDCSNIKFSDCEFHDNRQFDLVNVDGATEDIQFFQCRFSDNEGPLFNLETDIVLDKCSINHVGDFGTVNFVKDKDCFWSHSEMEPKVLEKDKAPTVPLLYYHWEGHIDNREVRLACARQDKVLIGELMMKNKAGTEFLKVLGMIDTDGEILFNVYDTENVCALRQIFLGHIVGKTLECFDEATQMEFKLRTYKGDVRYAMDREADAYCSPFSKSTIYYFKADNRELAGGYSFFNMTSYSEHYGRIDISRSGDDLEVMEFSIDYKNKGRQALTDGKSILDGNTFKHHLSYGECDYEFEVVFYNGFLIIHSLSGKPYGCFDSNTSIEGIYVQESSVG